MEIRRFNLLENSNYLIYELLDQEDLWNIKLSCKVVFEDNKQEFVTVERSEIYAGPTQMKMVIYESDTLEDAKDYVSMITSAKKYNL